MKRPHSFVLLAVSVCLLVVAVAAHPTVAASAGRNSLEAAWQESVDAGTCRFGAEVEQTLVPRPVPGMIVQTDERLDMRLEGNVTLPDQNRLCLQLRGAGLGSTLVELAQNGSETYLFRSEERFPVQNPAGLSAPMADYLGYRAAAMNVRPCARHPRRPPPGRFYARRPLYWNCRS
jgi:hypothetical protein